MIICLVIQWVGDWQIRCFILKRCCGLEAKDLSDYFVITFTPIKQRN